MPTPPRQQAGSSLVDAVRQQEPLEMQADGHIFRCRGGVGMWERGWEQSKASQGPGPVQHPKAKHTLPSLPCRTIISEQDKIEPHDLDGQGCAFSPKVGSAGREQGIYRNPQPEPQIWRQRERRAALCWQH